MKIKTNQQGIAHWLILLIILILIAIGFVGWRVWDARSSEDIPVGCCDTPDEKTAEVEENLISPASDNYQVALPEGWVSGECADSPDLLFLAPTEDKLGKCNSEFGGTVLVSRNDGNIGYGADYYTDDPYYGDAVYEAVSIDGIDGYKVSYTVAGDESLVGGPAVGTQITSYVLFDGTSTFSIIYTRLAGDPDLSAQAQSIAESFDSL